MDTLRSVASTKIDQRPGQVVKAEGHAQMNAEQCAGGDTHERQRQRLECVASGC